MKIKWFKVQFSPFSFEEALGGLGAIVIVLFEFDNDQISILKYTVIFCMFELETLELILNFFYE